MTTKAQFIAQLKLDYPTLKTGDDESGYVELNAQDYEATITKWAESLVDQEIDAVALENAKLAAEAKLAALNLTPDDLKALGF